MVLLQGYTSAGNYLYPSTDAKPVAPQLPAGYSPSVGMVTPIYTGGAAPSMVGSQPFGGGVSIGGMANGVAGSNVFGSSSGAGFIPNRAGDAAVAGMYPTSVSTMGVARPEAPSLAPAMIPISGGGGGSGGGATAIANAFAKTGDVRVNISNPTTRPIDNVAPSLIGSILSQPSNFNPPGIPNIPAPNYPTQPGLMQTPNGPQAIGNMPLAPAQNPISPGTGGGGTPLSFLQGQVSKNEGVPSMPQQGGGGGTGGGGGAPGMMRPAPGGAARPSQAGMAPAGAPGQAGPGQPGQAPGMPGQPMGRFMGNMPPTGAALSPQHQALANAMHGRQTPGMPITAQAAGGGYGGQPDFLMPQSYEAPLTPPQDEQQQQQWGGGVYPPDYASPNFGASVPAGGGQSRELQVDEVARDIHNAVIHMGAELGPRAREIASQLARNEDVAMANAHAQFEPAIERTTGEMNVWRIRARKAVDYAQQYQAGNVDWDQINAAAENYANHMAHQNNRLMPMQERPGLGAALGFKPRAGLLARNYGVEAYNKEAYDERRDERKEWAKAKEDFVKRVVNGPINDYKMASTAYQQAQKQLDFLIKQQAAAGKEARLVVAQQARAQMDAIKLEGKGAGLMSSAANAEQRNENQDKTRGIAQQNANTNVMNAQTRSRGVNVQENREKRIQGNDSLQKEVMQSTATRNKSQAQFYDAKREGKAGSGFVEPPGGNKPVSTAGQPLQGKVAPTEIDYTPQKGEAKEAWIKRMVGAGYDKENLRTAYNQFFGQKVAKK
jgi:hypothetical protein